MTPLVLLLALGAVGAEPAPAALAAPPGATAGLSSSARDAWGATARLPNSARAGGDRVAQVAVPALALAAVTEVETGWVGGFETLLSGAPQLRSSLVWGVALLGVGLWLVLPRGGRRGRAAGAVLIAAGLGFFASWLPLLGGWDRQSVFYVLAATTVVAGIGTVSMRSPVYSALWFALALLGTAGLFVFVGAQFLGVATVVVYAGAIVVTFLFVLMLSQPEGHAYYDRLSWEAMLSAATGTVLVFILSLVIEQVFGGASAVELAARAPAPAELKQGVLAPQHVATLGGQMFGRYLVAVEVAGVLLLVALVGASAIAIQGRRDAAGAGPDGPQEWRP